MKSACIGTCDCCDEQNVEVCQTWTSDGIETWACDVCRGVEPKRPRSQAEPMALITLALVLAIIAVPVIVAVTQMPPRLAVHSMWGGAR